MAGSGFHLRRSVKIQQHRLKAQAQAWAWSGERECWSRRYRRRTRGKDVERTSLEQ